MRRCCACWKRNGQRQFWVRPVRYLDQLHKHCDRSSYHQRHVGKRHCFQPRRPISPIYSVKMLNIGSQFVKSNPTDPNAGTGVDNGVIEYSWMEYTGGTPSNPSHPGGTGYTQALSAHTADNWIVRNNFIKDLHTPDGSANVWNPAILFWNHSQNALVENNIIVNADRAIGMGLIKQTSGTDSSDGTVRNNFIYYAPGLYSSSRKAGTDGAIIANDSPSTKVYHNAILTNGNYNFSVEYRFSGSSAGEVRNNLADAPLNLARDGASAVQSGNLLTASPGMFVNASAADLHLLSTASAAINTAPTLAAVTTDIDGQTRPIGTAYDIGADEFSSDTVPPPPPPPPLANNAPVVSQLLGKRCRC